MLLAVGLILILAGYSLLFFVPENATYERLMLQAISGMGISILGAIIVMIHLYRKSRQ